MDKRNKITKEAAEKWIELLKERNGLCDQGFNAEAIDDLAGLLFTDSIQKIKTDTIAMAKLKDSNALVVFGPNMAGFDADYVYEKEEEISFCRLSHTNAVLLRKLLPFTAPSPLSDMDITFGLGDRLGIASPGHIRLFKNNNACPVLAQQSVRELDLTARTYEDVLDAATWAVFQEGYDFPWGADGDHLKTVEWVKKALDIGFTMITADVSDYIRNEYDALDDTAITEAYEKLDRQYHEDIEKRYLGLSIELDTGDTISFTKQELAKTALIYKDAVEHAIRLYETGKATEQPFDFEFSIDETETPTLPQAHVFTASETIKNNIKISSLAPRFIGEFQKGIDYIGDKDEFEKAFKVHAAIARHFGYRISVHSGSDKFMVFPIIGRETQGRFHIKTAGTNWLQAVEVISQQNPEFFRKLYAYALEVFPIAKQYYHITPNMDNLPNLDEMNDEQLPSIFTNNDARQVIHVTYGEILRNPDFKDRIYAILEENIEAYWLSLEKHIGKHLERLGVE